MAEKKVFPPTAVAYIGQIEHEYMAVHKLIVCANCFALGLQKPLKRCNGCRLVDYCSKECQKSHWPKHRAFCNLVQAKGAKNAYLTKLKTPEEVFQTLIDSYRLRVELDHIHRGEDHGIYFHSNGAKNPTTTGESSDDNGEQPPTHPSDLVWYNGPDAALDFQRYIDLAEESGVLPQWWRFENRMECLSEAVDTQQNKDGNIYTKLDQEQLITKYEGDTSIRSALCVIAELVVGYGGKGRAMDNKWYDEFRDYLDLHPEEKARLLEGTIAAVKQAGNLAQLQDIAEAEAKESG